MSRRLFKLDIFCCLRISATYVSDSRSLGRRLGQKYYVLAITGLTYTLVSLQTISVYSCTHCGHALYHPPPPPVVTTVPPSITAMLGSPTPRPLRMETCGKEYSVVCVWISAYSRNIGKLMLHF